MEDKDIVDEPFLDRMTFTMEPSLFDWDEVDKYSKAKPTSESYRKIMKEMKLTGRVVNRFGRLWRNK